jgi:branched-chain amino acid transport system permease protein
MATFRPGGAGIGARAAAALLLAGLILWLPFLLQGTHNLWVALAAIYGVIGLSVNIITGHAGQISLGHQAFVGIGAFMSAFLLARMGAIPFAPSVPTANFFIAVAAAGAMGTILALVLGLIALRIRGLYLALITLTFGLMSETAIFNWRAFTGGGAGASAPRPAAFASDRAFVYVCFLFLALFLFVDWRLVRSRAGRAIVALRNDERVAATLGVNVTGYKLLAFAVAGFLAGTAGALFAHWNQAVQAQDFELRIALVWILMAVVGGLGSRAGVVAGSAFFAVFPLWLQDVAGASTITLPLVGEVLIQILAPFFGALLLLLTITLYPGGIGQQLLPIRRWMAGGVLVEERHEAMRLAGLPALLSLVVALFVLSQLTFWLRLLVAVGVAAVVAVAAAFGLVAYLRATHRSVRRARAAAPAGAPAPVTTAAVSTAAAIADETIGDVPAPAASGEAADELPVPPGVEEATADRSDDRPGVKTVGFRRKRGS